MTKQIISYTYVTEPKEIVLTYDDDTTETFTQADAERYVELTGRPDDAIAIGWTYTATANEDPNV
jgi:hypothetical protein